MKKQFLLSIVIVLTPLFYIQAQFISRGSLTGGGSFGFEMSTDKTESGGSTTKYKAVSFSFAPAVQYYVIDNLGIGGVVSLNTGTNKHADADYKSTYTSVLIGPSIRYYVSNGFFLSGSYALGFSKSKTRSSFINSEGTSNNSQANFGAGYSVRINDHILLDPMVGYEHFGIKDKDDTYASSQGGLYLRVGFTMILNRK
jgi:hypothetical protein